MTKIKKTLFPDLEKSVSRLVLFLYYALRCETKLLFSTQTRRHYMETFWQQTIK